MGLIKRILGIFSGSTSSSPFGPGRPFEYNPFSDSGTEPPDEAGWYRVCDAAGDPQYDGITNDLPRRLVEHIRAENIKLGEKFVYKVAKKGTPYEQLRSHEVKKIERDKPPRNLRGGGGGRTPK
jgi:hypothetical protein